MTTAATLLHLAGFRWSQDYCKPPCRYLEIPGQPGPVQVFWTGGNWWVNALRAGVVVEVASLDAALRLAEQTALESLQEEEEI